MITKTKNLMHLNSCHKGKPVTFSYLALYGGKIHRVLKSYENMQID